MGTENAPGARLHLGAAGCIKIPKNERIKTGTVKMTEKGVETPRFLLHCYEFNKYIVKDLTNGVLFVKIITI